MKLTQADICERLGLEDPQSFHARRYGQVGFPKQSGRTTWMLIEVLKVAQEHEVVILCHTERSAKMLKDRVYSWAMQLGIDYHRIKVRCYNPDGLIGGTKAVFADHAVLL